MNNDKQDQMDDYTECYVAFLDILGFKEWVTRSEKDAKILSDLVRVLNAAADLGPTYHSKRELVYDGNKCVGSKSERQWLTQIRAFSDCVALFIPAETHGLTNILCKVRYLHDRCFELGCCLRGAVTIGGMYWNDAWSMPADNSKSEQDAAPVQGKCIAYDMSASSNAFITLGPALCEAYKLESEVAVYPRIIFSQRLMAHITKMSKVAPENSVNGIHKAVHASPLCSPCGNHSRCILDFIRSDSDRVPFLDVFHQDINRNDTERIEYEHKADGSTYIQRVPNEMTHEQFMRCARKAIEGFLGEKNAEKIRAKHLWLANYFNMALAQYNIEPIPVRWNSNFE